MSLAWNPFDPGADATRLATAAYWEARYRGGVVTNNTAEQHVGMNLHRPRLTKIPHLARNPDKPRTVPYGLQTYEPAEIRRYTLAATGDTRLREIHKIRAAIQVMHHISDWRFRSRAHATFLEVLRLS